MNKISSRLRSRTIPLVPVLVLVAGFMVAGATPAHATSTLVDCATGGDLAAAITAAVPGTTLGINGTCVGNFVVGKNLTLSGFTGAMLDGGGAFTTLWINSPAKVKVTGLTITGGVRDVGGGGGIFNFGTLTVTNSTVSGNSAFAGAGIENGGTLTVTNSTLSGNSAVEGGGIENGGTLTISNSTLSGNSAGSDAGGIRNFGTLTISNSTLSGNSAGSDAGGGIRNFGTLTISNSTLSGNSAGSQGGGIHNSNTATVSNSTLIGNTSTVDGGGIYNDFELTVANSTLSGNSAGGSGGGIRNDDHLRLSNSTVSGNSSTYGGGGVSSVSDGALVGSSIIAGNTGAGVSSDCINVSSYGYNLIGDADGCAYSLGTGDQIGSSLGSGAIDPMLGPLASNGGSTQTMALMPGSPAVDAIGIGALGDDLTPMCPSSGTKDQRGTVRPQGIGCDIGAYELKAPWIGTVWITAASGGGSPSVSGAITCNQGATFVVSVTLTQGKKQALGLSPLGLCLGGLVPVGWTAPVSPGTFSSGAAKVSYTATDGTTSKKGKVPVTLT